MLLVDVELLQEKLEVNTRAVILSTRTISCISPMYILPWPSVADADIVTVYVFVHESRLSTSMSIAYIRPPAIFDFTPTSGPARGGTVVTISGNGLARKSFSLCLFGGLLSVDPYRVTRTSTLCVTPQSVPSFSDPPTVTLSVVPPAWRLDLNVQFTYFAVARVLHVSPNFGSTSGGSVVHINGKSFPQFTHAACLFNTTIVLATQREKEVRTRLITPLRTGLVFEPCSSMCVGAGNTMRHTSHATWDRKCRGILE